MLLAAIAWGSTAELTHHHGAKTQSGGSISSTNQSSIPDEVTPTHFSSSETNGPSSKSKSGADCLICQLHQNLSATEISHAPGQGPTETLGLNTRPGAVAKLSAFTSTGHGRAPPVNL
jgi:hypothetical protein